MIFFEEIFSTLNNNPSIITIIGWLLLFLLGFYTQRSIVGTNTKIQFFKDFIDKKNYIIKKYQRFNRSNLAVNLQIDYLSKYFEIRKLLATMEIEDAIKCSAWEWKNFEEDQDSQVEEFRDLAIDLNDFVLDLCFFEPRINKVWDELHSRYVNAEQALLKYGKFISSINPIEYNPPEQEQAVLNASRSVDDYLSYVKHELSHNVQKILLSGVFREYKIGNIYEYLVKAELTMDVPDIGENKKRGFVLSDVKLVK